DNSIDDLVTADVFEHVRFDDLAFREVYRVLRPGGYFFLQVPYEHSERTRILVQPDGDQDIYLCPPLYHDEHTLVYRIYGHNRLPQGCTAPGRPFAIPGPIRPGMAALNSFEQGHAAVPRRTFSLPCRRSRGGWRSRQAPWTQV